MSSASRRSPELARSYDEWHAPQRVDEETESPWHQMVKGRLPSLAGARVLEVGCGRGGLARWLAGRDPAILVAEDLSSVGVAKAAGFGSGTAARFAVADICHLPHPDSRFSLVVSCETIEHVPDPARAVRDLARVLEPGGRLFLTTPNYLGTLGLFRIYRRLVGRPFKEEGQPLNNLTMVPRTLHWLRAAGLVPRLVDAMGHYLLLPGRSRAIPIKALDGPRPVLRWLAHHQLIVAVKPAQAPSRRGVRRSG